MKCLGPMLPNCTCRLEDGMCGGERVDRLPCAVEYIRVLEEIKTVECPVCHDRATSILRTPEDIHGRCINCLSAQLKKSNLALALINDIRNGIVAAQTVGWSAHIYPLVAALNAAGFKGLDYEEAKKADTIVCKECGEEYSRQLSQGPIGAHRCPVRSSGQGKA